MKKVLIAFIILSMAACGGGGSTAGTPGPAGPEGPPGPQGDPGVAAIPAGTTTATSADKVSVVSGTLTPDSGVSAGETSGAAVYAVGQQGSGTTTDANGNYTLTINLASASQISVVQKPLLRRIAEWMQGGPKAVSAFTQVGLVAISSSNGYGKKINLNLQDGTAVNLPNITITKVGRISGNVKLQNGTDHTGIMVYIPGTSFLALTDAAGNFTITNVPEGDYNYLRAEKSGYKHSMLSSITVASNATTTVHDQLLLIDTGATGSILINTGAAVSANKQVTVNVAASSTAILMLYSESSIFLNAAWEPLQSSFNYTFATEGAKTLYIKFADANGLESPVYSDSITINSNWTAPLTAPSSGTRTNSTTPTFTWTADALAATYDLVISKNADLSAPDLTVTGITAATDTLTAGQSLPASAGQLYYWSVRPVDATGVAGGYATASSFTLDTVAPAVSSKTPAAGAVAVANTSAVSAIFGEALDTNSLASGTFTVATTAGSVQKTGAISYDSATNTATFTPSGNLAGTTQYTASLTTAIKDAAGNPLAALYSWNFTTAAGWVHPAGVSDQLGNANVYTTNYDVAMDNSGNIVVAYLSEDNGGPPVNRVYIATFNRGTRTWTYPATKTSADYFGVGAGAAYPATNPKVALNTAGHMVLTWEQSNGTNNQVFEAECFGGNFTFCQSMAHWTKPAGTGNHISVAGATNAVGGGTAVLALDDASDKAVIAWTQIDSALGASRVYRSFYSAGWTHPAAITSQIDPTGYCGGVTAAFKGGKGLIAWYGFAATNVIYVSMYNGAAWTDPVLANKMSTDTALKYATNPQVAMSANGTGVLVWNQTDGTATHVFANTWKGVSAYDGTGWGIAPLPVGLTAFINPAIGDGSNPKVAMDGVGKAVVAWRQKNDNVTKACNYAGCDEVFKSTYSGAAWTNPTGNADYISLNGQNAGDPSVAMDAAGNGLIVWSQAGGPAGYSLYKSELRSGTWTNPSASSDAFGVKIPAYQSTTTYTSAVSPYVAQMGNSGEAIVIWQQSDGTNGCMMSTGCNQIFKSEYR